MPGREQKQPGWPGWNFAGDLTHLGTMQQRLRLQSEAPDKIKRQRQR